MGQARMIITYDLLEQMMNLPSGSRLSNAQPASEMESFGHPDIVFEMTIEHPDLPDIVDGERLPLVVPQFTTVWATAFKDWGTLGGE